MRMVNPRYIITWLHGWNIEYRNTLEGWGFEWFGCEESSKRVKLKSLLVSNIHSFDVTQFVPQCFLESVCRGMDGGSMVVDHCRRSEWVLKLAPSNVAVYWTVKFDLWISKNRLIVDIRSSRRRWSRLQVLWQTAISGMWGSKLKIPSPLEGPPGDNLRATKWSSKVSRR